MHVLDLPPMEQVSLDGTDRSTPPRISGKARKSCSRQGLWHLRGAAPAQAAFVWADVLWFRSAVAGRRMLFSLLGSASHIPLD